MMKIETKTADGQLIFQVEGRLAGAFVPELERCWLAARAEQPSRKISLDLKSVICVDFAGRRLLQSMHDAGVDFLGAGIATQDILDQLTTRADCRR
jgi:anti-anti-sigma regulatory factor